MQTPANATEIATMVEKLSFVSLESATSCVEDVATVFADDEIKEVAGIVCVDVLDDTVVTRVVVVVDEVVGNADGMQIGSTKKFNKVAPVRLHTLL